jgi:ABC-type phosphate/phosphonate transport system substrate-binding protein
VRWWPATTGTAALAGNAADCPNDGVVRFGIEPYDTAPKLIPIYEHIGKVIAEKLGCEVKIFVTTTYNAEIEAMRNGKLEIAEFGPLGYVLAHQVAKAEAVSASSHFGVLRNPSTKAHYKHISAHVIPCTPSLSFGTIPTLSVGTNGGTR